MVCKGATMMKAIALLFLIVTVCWLILCDNSPAREPEFRVHNENSGKANVQIKTTGGNTININDIDSGYVSGYQSAAQGLINVTSNVQGDTTTATLSFDALNNNLYTIVILDSHPTALQVVSP
jgi:catabolite regulation protein CreA